MCWYLGQLSHQCQAYIAGLRDQFMTAMCLAVVKKPMAYHIQLLCAIVFTNLDVLQQGSWPSGLFIESTQFQFTVSQHEMCCLCQQWLQPFGLICAQHLEYIPMLYNVTKTMFLFHVSTCLRTLFAHWISVAWGCDYVKYWACPSTLAWTIQVAEHQASVRHVAACLHQDLLL